MYSGIKLNKDLVGNLILFLAEKCQPLCQTKLLKLLYLIDEESTKRYGTPITWLPYRVWKLGPVAQDVFFAKYPGTNLFSDYVKFDFQGSTCIVRPANTFDDSEFSELDMEVISDIAERYGKLSASQLVKITHRKGSLWSNTKEREHISFTPDNSTSEAEIDFSELLDDGMKKTVYYNALESKLMESGIC
ncbi:MAG: Panacea domain-containing protein [Bacteroides sp.]|nr:Panacea domain-containing protein [Ruminococcus flavefaciens]MCM1554335.1 Panacea domain-containing protein [Bacteroides sp.]